LRVPNKEDYVRPSEESNMSEESEPTPIGTGASVDYSVVNHDGEVATSHRVDTTAAAGAFLSRFAAVLRECLHDRCEVNVAADGLLLHIDTWDAGTCEIQIQPGNGFFGSVWLVRPDCHPSSLPSHPEVAIGVVLAKLGLG
jgi:hypothetical protein